MIPDPDGKIGLEDLQPEIWRLSSTQKGALDRNATHVLPLNCYCQYLSTEALRNWSGTFRVRD